MPTDPQSYQIHHQYDNRCNPSSASPAGDYSLRQPKRNPNPKLLTFILKSIIMILVISFFFLFLGIAAIAVLHLLLSGAHRRSRRGREVSPEDLDRIPMFRYTGECHVKDCAVCLEGFREGDTCRRLPGCRHVYHSRCVDRWLVKVATCPICRTRVRLETSSGGFGCVEDESKVLWSIRG